MCWIDHIVHADKHLQALCKQHNDTSNLVLFYIEISHMYGNVYLEH